jgi:hypothetical protein
MPFHRFVDPTYNLLGGTFPGTIGTEAYDRINVVSGGTGAGGSANADGAKPSGANAGTYWLGFGEDARSVYANRGFRALAENTDTLDDILRTNTPRPSSQNFASPAGVYLTLTGLDVFVGDTAATPASSLVQVVSQSTGEQIYSSAGVPVIVTAIDAGAAPSIIGSGFATAPRVTFSDTVTVPVTILYGSRTSFARSTELPDREQVFSLAMASYRRALYGESVHKHGLDEAYRRAKNLRSSSVTAGLAGDGAVIRRDGRALTVYGPERSLAGVPPATPYYDPFMALLLATNDPTSLPAAGTDLSLDGQLGVVSFAPHRTSVNGSPTQTEAGEPVAPGRFRSSFVCGSPVNIQSSTVAGQPVFTRIGLAAPATVAGDVITVTAPNFPGTVNGSRIVNGLDYVLVDFGSGDQRAYAVADTTDTTITIRTLGGATPALSAGSVTITWYQVVFQAGGESGFLYCPPRPVGAYAPVHPVPAFVSPDAVAAALETGYVDTATGNVVRSLTLAANGGITGVGGSVHHAFRHRVVGSTIAGAATTVTVNNAAGVATAGAWNVRVITAGACTVTVATAAAPLEGQVFELLVRSSAASDVTMAWGANFLFDDPSEAVFPSTTTVYSVRWRGTAYETSSGVVYFMERTDFEVA